MPQVGHQDSGGDVEQAVPGVVAGGDARRSRSVRCDTGRWTIGWVQATSEDAGPRERGTALIGHVTSRMNTHVRDSTSLFTSLSPIDSPGDVCPPGLLDGTDSVGGRADAAGAGHSTKGRR